MWSSWDNAIEQLQSHTGDWWLVSPYITVTPDTLDGHAPGGDLSNVKILTTADPADFVRGSSSLDVLRSMVERGADIRAHDRLHAKAYLRRQGNVAVGWLGSANLTDRARQTNHEVMSGPLVLDRTFLQQLDHLWTNAQKVDAAALRRLDRQVADERARQQPTGATLPDVLVLSIEERKAGKQFDIAHTLLKLGIDESTARNIRTQAVSFIDADYRDKLQAWRKEQLDRLTRGKPPLMVRLAGGNTLYACVKRNLPDVERTLRELDAEGRTMIDGLRGGAHDDLKVRFISHLHVWQKTYGGLVDQKTVAELFLRAYDEFDRYLASDVFGVDFNLLVPVMPNDRHHPWYAPEPLF